MNPKFKNLLIRTLTGAVYVTLMIMSIFNPWILTFLYLFIIAGGLHESAKLSSAPVDKFTKAFWIVTGCIVFLFTTLDILPVPKLQHFIIEYSAYLMFGIVLLALSAFLFFIILDVVKFRQLAATTLFNMLWIVVPLIILARNAQVHSSIVLAFLILIWASDTFAYLGGSLFGKHKLCERISPGKTWEGFIISLLLTIGLAIGMSFIGYFNDGGFYNSILEWVIFATIVVVFGLFGDLYESLLKRQAGVKDSGSIIPGHGGILDRFDSIFVATYPAFLFVMIL